MSRAEQSRAALPSKPLLLRPRADLDLPWLGRDDLRRSPLLPDPPSDTNRLVLVLHFGLAALRSLPQMTMVKI